MEHQCDAICLKNGVTLAGLEQIVFSAIVSYPTRDVYAEILRDGSRYSLHPLDAPPSPQQPSSSTYVSRVGSLFSKRLRNAFDYDFERRLQPSILDLRSMYESGDTLRAFIVTNGVGWAFRLFDFQSVSLAELNWLEFGFVRAMQTREALEGFFSCIPKRMALGLLQSNNGIIEFLVDELMTIFTEIERLQDYYNTTIPAGQINDLLSVAPGVLVVGEAFRQKDELQPKAVFEQHIVEAFNAVRQGDNKSAFGEVVKFALPIIRALTEAGNGASKLERITDMNSRLHQLRLPDVPESKRLRILIEFLEATLECAYLFLKEGHDKRMRLSNQEKQSGKKADDSAIPHLQIQASEVRELKFRDVERFALEATRCCPNRVTGQIVQLHDQENSYAITDVRLVPCDVAITISLGNVMRRDSVERSSAESSKILVGRSVSKVCCCEQEMLTLLHPSTYTLNEMLRSGYSLNAIAVTNGEKCLLRLHDGSNNTILTASLPPKTTGG